MLPSVLLQMSWVCCIPLESKVVIYDGPRKQLQVRKEGECLCGPSIFFGRLCLSSCLPFLRAAMEYLIAWYIGNYLTKLFRVNKLRIFASRDLRFT